MRCNLLKNFRLGSLRSPAPDRLREGRIQNDPREVKGAVLRAFAGKVGAEAFSTEYFRLVRGRVGGPFDSHGRETDLFAGL